MLHGMARFEIRSSQLATRKLRQLGVQNESVHFGECFSVVHVVPLPLLCSLYFSPPRVTFAMVGEPGNRWMGSGNPPTLELL